LRYSPVADGNNSINSNSIGKTDFWKYAPKLFGKNLQPGEGLTGLYMPADNPNPQKLHYNNKHAWFSAEGIPITPIDDKGQVNPYPMLRINVILHDKEHKTDLKNQTPVLCASCHYSPPLDLARAGPQGKQKELPTSSQVMHQYHGKLRDKQGSLIFPDNASVEETCYQCHPGKKTQCQSCHTGDAVNHLNEAGLVFGNDKFRLKQTYKIGDPTASPLNPGSLPMTTKGPHGLFT
jgi:hypothetical protein